MELLQWLISYWNILVPLLVTYGVCLAFYRLFFHPLARFPGPKLAAVTRWYEAYYDVVEYGQYTFKIAEMHKKYGTVIPAPHPFFAAVAADNATQVQSSASVPLSSTSATQLSTRYYIARKGYGTSTHGL